MSAYFCVFFNLLQFSYLQNSVPRNKSQTGQNHGKIKSRTLQAPYSLSWTSLSFGKVQFCPVKNEQNPANMLPIKHLCHMGIFRKILQVLHVQHCVSHFKDLLKSVLCHLYTTALPPMCVVLEQCTTYLPLSTMRNVCSVSKLVKNATWHNDRTKRHIQRCIM